MTRRRPCPVAPGPLEEYAARFDDLFGRLAQRRGFREYLAGLLAPRDRNKTLTALAGAEPVTGAQHPAVHRLQFFLSESRWDPEKVNARRLELLLADPATAPHDGGVLVIDDSGDRKDGTKTAHVGRQWLGRYGKTDNGVVTVTTLWADERVYYPVHAVPYTPARHFAKGKSDPAFRTKLQIAAGLAIRARDAGIAFRAAAADCAYGDQDGFRSEFSEAGLPFVMALKPRRGTWAYGPDAHTPVDAPRALAWGGPDNPGDWHPVVRTFRDGHAETWWAAEATLGWWGPDGARRLVAITADPGTLPGTATWYLVTNLPRHGGPRERESPWPEPETETLTAEYYDTSDLWLLQAGITLRRRHGGADEGWHLKLPAEAHSAQGTTGLTAPVSRDELRLPLQRSGDPVPDELARLMLAYTRGMPLRLVARIETRSSRTTLRDATGTSLAEVAADEVAAQALGASSTLSRCMRTELAATTTELVMGPAQADVERGADRGRRCPPLGPSWHCPRPQRVSASYTQRESSVCIHGATLGSRHDRGGT